MSDRDRQRGGRGGRSFEPPLPKPYDFVPLPQKCPDGTPPAGHHRYHTGRLSGTLTAQMIARSPVHVASGLLKPVPDRDYPMVKEHFRTGDTPTIPGTSLKGCIRSIVEAISCSTVQVTRMRSPTIDRPPQVRDKDKRDNRVQLDVAQNIFGAMGYQGLVCFRDARLEQGEVITVPTPQLFRPRPESIDTYLDGQRPKGRKFYMHGSLAPGNLPLEACAEGSRFALRMEFENLTPGELGLLLFALGLGEPRWWPKLGGAKPACLGTIEISTPELVALDAHSAYADFDLPAPAPQEVQPLLDAAHSEKLILNAQVKKLAEVLHWPRKDRACPDRNY